MGKSKFYTVWEGHRPGVYASWDECRKQIEGYADARYKSYATLAEAEQALSDGWRSHWGRGSAARPAAKAAAEGAAAADIDYDSISVDVGTRGNPGPVEYKGVDTRTGETVFEVGPIAKGTNNLGEFLAIVHALAYLHKRGSGKTVYSDSLNAIKWVKQRRVSTTLPRDETTSEMWGLIDRAERWLATHAYTNKVLKWQTDKWGEIKADYGRK